MHISACDFVEERRLSSRVDVELGKWVAGDTKLRYRADYGNFEEGGDVSLFELKKDDCANLAGKFGDSTEAQSRTRYYDTFAQIGIRPKAVHVYFAITGVDPVEYVLDPGSCIIYRVAHFE